MGGICGHVRNTCGRRYMRRTRAWRPMTYQGVSVRRAGAPVRREEDAPFIESSIFDLRTGIARVFWAEAGEPGVKRR